MTFLIEYARHQCKHACRCALINGSRARNTVSSIESFSEPLLEILTVTVAPIGCRIDYNDKSGALRIALTIDRYSSSAVSLGRLLPSWHCILEWFTHSCQHRLIISKFRAIQQLDQPISLSPTTRLLSHADICTYCFRGIVTVYLSTFNKILKELMTWNRNFRSLIPCQLHSTTLQCHMFIHWSSNNKFFHFPSKRVCISISVQFAFFFSWSVYFLS